MKKTYVSTQTVNQLLKPSTATITTVLKNSGIRHSAMYGVTPLSSKAKMAGPAFTLRYIPAREDLDDLPVDNLTNLQRVGIENISSGDVFVIDARGDDRAGGLGAILAARLQVRGAAGVVTDGAYRDSLEIERSGFPAFARSMNAHANVTVHHPSEIEVPIACGGVAVFPGDIIVGDGEGVVVVPSHLAERVAEEAKDMEEQEEFLMGKIRAGASLDGTYPPGEKLLDEYEVLKRTKSER